MEDLLPFQHIYYNRISTHCQVFNSIIFGIFNSFPWNNTIIAEILLKVKY